MHVTLKALRCMDWIPKAIGFVVQGVNSNWWGIACPAHCFGVGLPSLLVATLLGLSLGFIFGFLLCAWLAGLLPAHPPHHPSEPGLGSTSSRLRAYLDEPSAIVRSRRRRD